MPEIVTENLIAEFRAWLAANSLSKDTVNCYTAYCSQFLRGRKVEEINNLAFFANLKEALAESKHPKSVHNYIMGIKKFLMFLNEIYALPIVDIFRIRSPKSSCYRKVEFLELEEIEAIRALPVGSYVDLWGRTLFEFLLYTGCRRGEAVSVKVSEINFEAGEVWITGKGQKQRCLFLSEATPWIRRLLKERKFTSDYLFSNKHGEKLSREHLSLVVRNMGIVAGTQRLYPHLLRSTFATYATRSGVEPRILQELLGHEDIKTTLRHYVGTSQEWVREAHTSFTGAFTHVS